MALISVIVPVYQVEAYINRCLDSLKAQTFSDFEAILVDDGSKDRSGEICEDYARRDPRFIVFHQENQGQSVARNFAMDWVYANSESTHISFVDSDDWVHPRYLELLYKAAAAFGANVSQCLHLETDGTASEPDVGADMQEISTEEQYTRWYSAFFWGKLFARACLEHIRFPEGQIYEDVAIWYKILFAEEKIGLVKETLYYYYINTSSTVRSSWKPARLAQVTAWDEQILYIEKNESSAVLKEALRRYCGVIKGQTADVQASDKVSAAGKKKYLRLLRKKLRGILRHYETELKQLKIYSDYYSLAYPLRIRLYKSLMTLKNPKKALKSGFYRVLILFSKPTILFESKPDFADNARPVYEEFLRRRLNKDFYLLWMDKNGEPVTLAQDGSVVSLLQEWTGLKRQLRLASLSQHVSAVVCCNRVHFPTDPTKTTVFYLSHGTPMKRLRGYYDLPQYIDFVLAASKDVAPICAYEFNVSPEKVFSLGFPRNDVFAVPSRDIRPMLVTDCSRVIVWYPTYRQNLKGKITGSTHALPVINDPEAAARLDHAAREAGVLIVLKPHFAQDTSLIRDLGLNNIRFIDDSFFTEHQITSYQFVNSCDAMITDYSSIYFDYLLADKPIAVTWDDLEEYRRDPGFAVDLERLLKGAVKAYNVDDLISFIQDVAAGQDVLQADRRRIRDMANYSTDGNNTNRVVDFILSKIKSSY